MTKPSRQNTAGTKRKESTEVQLRHPRQAFFEGSEWKGVIARVLRCCAPLLAASTRRATSAFHDKTLRRVCFALLCQNDKMTKPHQSADKNNTNQIKKTLPLAQNARIFKEPYIFLVSTDCEMADSTRWKLGLRFNVQRIIIRKHANISGWVSRLLFREKWISVVERRN